ncbi:hypothetical protein HMPREF9533_00868 [Escherichia coli MS 60-1]|nr:hypothetical protein HMPREF9533_00868 [Escherichia coli MS 60-1]
MNGYFARWQGNFNYYLCNYRRKNKRHDTAVVPLLLIAYCCAFVAAPEIALPPSEMSSPTPRVVLQAVNTVESTRTEKIAAIVFFTITSSF